MKKVFSMVASLALVASFAFAQSPADTYVYMTFGGVDTLDPEGAYDTASGTILENVYETLYSYDGDSITEYVPALATDHAISDGGKVYTYNLREGVSFHSGNTMSCRDVEYSFERMLVMNDASSGVWFQAEAFLGNHGENANDDDTITFERIDSAIECADDSTVVFTLPKVDPAFFVKIMYTNASIIDSAWAIENGEWDGTEATWRDWVGMDPREGYLHDNMSGTGAYKLVSWDGTDTIAEAFDGYWGGAAPIKNVQIRVVDEEATRILALQNGDADRIGLNDFAVLESQVRGLEGVTIHEDPSWASLSVSAGHFNQGVEVEDNEVNIGCGELGCGIPADFFSDINVRKAFNYSFDPDVLMEELYLGNGVELTMALPPSFLGYDASAPTYSFDPEAAEAAFKEAWGGAVWEEGFEITLSYNTGNTTRQTVVEILKANIEDLNSKFKVNVRGIQWPDFLADRRANKLPLSVVGWAPDYADPDNYVYTFYHSNGYYGELLNFSDADLDQYIDDARSTTDSETRAIYYGAAAQRAYDLAPFIIIPTRKSFMVSRDNLEGLYLNPMLSHAALWKNLSKN